MDAAIVRRTDTGFTIQLEVPYMDSMLDAEQAIQNALNRAGVVATEEALRRFDADGQPIRLGPTKLTSMGKVRKEYQTPYGVAIVERHVYQSSRGGKTHCPLDQDARIVVSSTPRFARMVAHKYAEFGAARVQADLAENHGRAVARAFVQDVADAVATVALVKEQAWEYDLPAFEEPVATVTVGLDGTCLLMCGDGWREAMVGTLGFYTKDGERLHTVYTAATPEYGKLTFMERFDRELDRAKAACPGATYVGLADGAKDNWIYLDLVTQEQVVDFYHAAQYLWKAAEALFTGAAAAGLRPWVEGWCHRLKHEPGAAAALIADLEARGRRVGQGAAAGGGRVGVDVPAQPGQGGADELRGARGAAHPDRQRGDRGGVQGAGQAASVPVGDAVEGARGGDGSGGAVPDVHAGALGPVLEPDRPQRLPGGGVTDCDDCYMIRRPYPQLACKNLTVLPIRPRTREAVTRCHLRRSLGPGTK